jgi:hypothetical protein
MHHKKGRQRRFYPPMLRRRLLASADGMRPSVGVAIFLLKNSCANKITRVSCAAFASRGDFSTNAFQPAFFQDTSMKPNSVNAILFALRPCRGADARARLACDGLRGEGNRHLDT